MATPTIDLTLLNYFSPILVFLFLFALFFALFRWSKFLGDMPSIHAVLALVIAFLGSIYSDPIRQLIEYIIPWFVGLMILLVMVLMLIKVMGVDDDTIETVAKQPGVYWTILILSLIIALGGLAHVFGDESLSFTQGDNNETSIDKQGSGSSGDLSTATGDVQTNTGKTFYHP
ncbi:MAG: hypothetical protein ACQESF_05165, partial [Nanobdellota archaeon]